MKQLISTGLWFDSNAEEAAKFYTSVFPSSEIQRVSRYGKEGYEIHQRPEGSVMSVEFVIAGYKFQGINGGPVFTMNPSISHFIICQNREEANEFWKRLSEGGTELMEFNKYEWSEAYGWVQDKYGLSWQIFTGEANFKNQKICPSLMFTGKQNGRAKEAIDFYTSIFKDSEIQALQHYPPGGDDPETSIMHSQFTLAGQIFMAMDSSLDHKFEFNEGVSLIVNCRTQNEIDYYWQRLTQGGQEVECGWLIDKFGMRWQIVPEQLDDMLTDPDAAKRDRVTKAFLKMKKFDIQKLEEAFAG